MECYLSECKQLCVLYSFLWVSVKKNLGRGYAFPAVAVVSSRTINIVLEYYRTALVLNPANNGSAFPVIACYQVAGDFC